MGWGGLTLGIKFLELLHLEASDEGQRSRRRPSWDCSDYPVASVVVMILPSWPLGKEFITPQSLYNPRCMSQTRQSLKPLET